MNIRAAIETDAAILAELHAQCFAQGWGEDFMGRVLAHPGAIALIALEQDVPAGFVLTRAVAGEAEILSLGVGRASRRRGLGAALIRRACLRAEETGVQEVFLEVSVENTPARTLYGRLGFREVGRRPDYYEDAIGAARDALVLRRLLPL